MKRVIAMHVLVAAASCALFATSAQAQTATCTSSDPNVTVEWSGFTNPPVPTSLLSLSVTLRIQNTGNGTTVDRQHNISTSAGSSSTQEYYTKTVTQISYSNAFGSGIIDPWDGHPQCVPSGVSGWYLRFDWNPSICPIKITVTPTTSPC